MNGRVLIFVALCAMSLAGLAIGWLWPEQIATTGEAFLDTLRNLGRPGMLVLALAQIAIAVSGVLPAALLGVVAGALYGQATGFVIVAVSTVVGGVLGFLVARSTARGLVEQVLARHPALKDHDSFVSRDGWRSVCLLRFSPVVPFAITSYVLGLSSISARDYVIGTVASLPSLFGYVSLGALTNTGLAAWSGSGALRLALLGAGAVATLLLILRIGRAYYMGGRRLRV